MKHRVIDGVTYYPRTTKEKDKFFAVISFVGSKIGAHTFYINEPQPTRSKARTIAVNHIKNIK